MDHDFLCDIADPFDLAAIAVAVMFARGCCWRGS